MTLLSPQTHRIIHHLVQKKKKKSNADMDADLMLDQAFSILTAAAKPIEESESSAYSKYIEQKLNSYTPRTRDAVQHEFSNIIFKASQGFYEYNNYPTVPTYNMNDVLYPPHSSQLLAYGPNTLPSNYNNSSASPSTSYTNQSLSPSTYDQSPPPSTSDPTPSPSIYNSIPSPSTYNPKL